jgi:hypothetical protein
VDRAHERTYTTAQVRDLVTTAGFEPPALERRKIDRFWGLFALTARTRMG